MMKKSFCKEFVYSLLAVSSVVLVNGIAWVGCSKSPEVKPEAQAISVQVMKLAPTNYKGYVEMVGNTEAPSTIEFQAQVSGYLQSTSTREGLMVKSNEVLFVIDPTTYQAEYDAAQAQLNIDIAKANKAKADLVRNKELVGQEVISAAQYDVYDAAAKEADASVELSRAKLKSAEINLNYTVIRAPFDGLLGEVKVRPGNLVSAGTSSLGSLSIIDPMWVTFPLSEQIYLQSTKNGSFEASAKMLEDHQMKASDEWATMDLIQLNGDIYSEKGRVFFVDKGFSPTTGTLKTKATFPNPKGYLRPNQFARLRIPAHNFTNVFVMPSSAILEMQSKSMVYIVDSENKVHMRSLDIVYKGNNEVVVQKGLNAGELLVTKGLLKLREGVVVQPMTQEEVQTQSQKKLSEVNAKIKERETTEASQSQTDSKQ